jgi:Cu(I)/Ag(I) efflux system membrane fusion protein/cobalt-zinc-cadmium efflux system membrane fusion protein
LVPDFRDEVTMMKKTITTGIATFVLGIGLTALVLTNPFQWEWMHQFGHAVMDPVDAGTGQLWTCGMHPQVLEDSPGTCPICGMNLVPVETETAAADLPGGGPEGERKIKYWRAPMDPTYIRDEPGKSPMGMDLIPVYEDEEENVPAGAIRIDPVFVQNMGVQSERVQRTDIPFTIRTVGTLTYDNDQIAWVNTKYEGWIESVYVNYVGEPVEKGQKLFEIYSPELVTTQKEYLQALDYAERMEGSDYPEIEKRARSLLASARERLAYWDISEDQSTRSRRRVKCAERSPWSPQWPASSSRRWTRPSRACS